MFGSALSIFPQLGQKKGPLSETFRLQLRPGILSKKLKIIANQKCFSIISMVRLIVHGSGTVILAAAKDALFYTTALLTFSPAGRTVT